MPRPTPFRTRLTMCALMTTAALGASGCGAEEPAAPAAGGRVAIALDEYFVRPQAVRAGTGRLEIALTNRGRLPHQLHLRRRRREVIEARTLMPGESTRVAAALPRGRYTLVCAISNHAELGMYGSLVVR